MLEKSVLSVNKTAKVTEFSLERGVSKSGRSICRAAYGVIFWIIEKLDKIGKSGKIN
jgi:hypothetical protein